MFDASIPALICLLESLRPVFTRPSFKNFMTLALGWVLVPGRRAVTGALVVTGVSQQRDHSAFHRFFSLARWEPDAIGRRLLLMILAHAPEDGPVAIALDDTLARKRGEHIFGIGSHPDPVYSTKKRKAFTFGHVWVVLTVTVRIPLFNRTWGLPIMLRLYRSKSTCLKKKKEYKKKTELAREMLDALASWIPERQIELAADSAYCNSTVLCGLAGNIKLFGSMRPDAVLTAPPPACDDNGRGGRPAVRGPRLPTPEDVYHAATYGWYAIKTTLYRRAQWITYQTWTAQWYRASGGKLLRIVITKTSCGNIPFRVFFCTDPDVSVEYLHVDAATIVLVADPARLDVVVTDNLFGDIVTDLAAAVTGGIGLAASGNINPDGTAPSMFEPVHGSAPDIAGQGTADPTAAILSAAMLAEHVGLTAQARAIDEAVAGDLASRTSTPRRTAEIGDAIAAAVERVHAKEPV
jgi:hypothetical protein